MPKPFHNEEFTAPQPARNPRSLLLTQGTTPKSSIEADALGRKIPHNGVRRIERRFAEQRMLARQDLVPLINAR